MTIKLDRKQIDRAITLGVECIQVIGLMFEKVPGQYAKARRRAIKRAYNEDNTK